MNEQSLISHFRDGYFQAVSCTVVDCIGYVTELTNFVNTPFRIHVCVMLCAVITILLLLLILLCSSVSDCVIS